MWKKEKLGIENSKVELIIGERDERWWGSAQEIRKKKQKAGIKNLWDY